MLWIVGSILNGSWGIFFIIRSGSFEVGLIIIIFFIIWDVLCIILSICLWVVVDRDCRFGRYFKNCFGLLKVILILVKIWECLF